MGKNIEHIIYDNLIQNIFSNIKKSSINIIKMFIYKRNL